MNEHVHPTMAPFLNWFGQPQTAHIISRESTGGCLEDTTTPVCSCGWRGRPVSQASDFQSTELANQEAQHRFSGASIRSTARGGEAVIALDNGGPAFPVPYSNEADGPTVMPTLGMSLRDYFAAKALPAIIERCAGDTMRGMTRQMTRQDYFAGRAYEVADAMLRAREAK